jgi:hypothetical protein
MKTNPRTGKPYLMITDDCPNLIAELPKLKWKKYASPKISEQKNRQEDIRDKDNHCYDALKYAMTFMDDLTPHQHKPETKRDDFHSAFSSSFKFSTQPSDYDDENWGDSWSGSSTMRELEG